MTGEQRAAFAQVRPLAEPLRLRMKADAEGFPIIPGKLGQIEWSDPAGRDLAVYSARMRMLSRLLAVTGVRRHQTGDDEFRLLFPPEALEQVAATVRARRKRQTSPNSLANLVSAPIQRGFRRPGATRDAEVGVDPPFVLPAAPNTLEEIRS